MKQTILLVGFFILASVALSGCDINGDYGSGFTSGDYDIGDARTGITVKFHTEEQLDISWFVNAWDRVQACTGLSVSKGPHIVVVEDLNRGTAAGVTYEYDRIIVVELAEILRLERTTILEHEMIHYLLFSLGVDTSLNVNHEYEMFGVCAPLNTWS